MNDKKQSTDTKLFTIENENESHKPHRLFCEMDELQNTKWKEAARWIKFEESVESTGRWSKPHVATLSLHSLLELRSYLVKGAVILNLPGDDFSSIIDHMLTLVIGSKLLDESKRELIKNALLLEHVHPFEKNLLSLIEKKASNIDILHINNSNNNNNNNSTPPLTQNASSNFLSINENSKPVFELNSSLTKLSQINLNPKSSLAFAHSTASFSSRSDQKVNQHFMRKIPEDSEASNVLVGEVDFLESEFTAFMRLEKPVVLNGMTEVPVPTRFIFIILGPKGNIHKYHEIGRSISTLMSDDIFHDVAYQANNRQELLNGFDEFLDQVTVLPPGEWDPNIRIKPPKKTLEKEERLEKMTAELNQMTSLSNFGIENEEYESHEDDPGLQFTGRFCGGLIDDIKRKAPFYLSDFYDGFNFQCLSSILFMYFACLSPIITFGGLLGTATDQNMSAIESLLSGFVCGVLYGLFSGQPLTLLGSTGPVLVFESILNNFSKENHIDYMGFRAWIGLWTSFILLVIVISDCSALVKYITRFTEESFASLIALIFIIESVDKLIQIKDIKPFSNDPLVYFKQYNSTTCFSCIDSNKAHYPLNETQCNLKGYDYIDNCKYTPDVFFFSVLLYMFTFFFAMTIRYFKTSRFFPTYIRTKVSDFGVVITIAVAVFIDWYFGFDTPKLIVPLKFETTIPSRGWFINPITRNSDKPWLFLAAILPALLATILIFMDQHISCVIINRKDNKLKKGGGYHLDLLIVAITIGINSFLGIPWFVAATVLSINHVISLKKESEVTVPGEAPKFLGVVEQRVTNTAVFLMIGFSVFLSNLLRMIPMPVLYGVFLYMGISSLNGIQFMNRILLLLMPEKYQPNYTYLRHVKTLKIHLFTLIQISSIVLLFVIKSNKKISILFPLMVLALVGIRKLMDYVFTQKELYYIDDIMPGSKHKKSSSITDSKDLEKEQVLLSKNNSKNELPYSGDVGEEVLNSKKQFNNQTKTNKFTNVPTILIPDENEDNFSNRSIQKSKL